MPETISPEFLALQQALMGRYSLERELGRGGMGIVFLARDVALDRLVAIKLLPPALAARPGLRERFLREAQTAAKLSHPHIVAIHAVESAGDLVWFVMAYVEGETLGARLRDRGALTPQEAARMVQETAWALGYAHGRGVVHRDVKPDNIMLESGTGRALVMDFGIAALAADDAGGEVFGTAQYISPEQANGEVVDGRADLYSLGVVTFLALTARLPFDAPDAATLMAMHITKPAPPVGSLAPGLPRRLAQAVDRCLAKNPSDRFPDGEALAESIATAIERRRELPAPVRAWITKGQELKQVYMLYAITGALPAWMVVLIRIADAVVARSPVTTALWLGPAIIATVATIFPFALHAGYRLFHTRRLMAAGYGIEDMRLALRDYAERRHEELEFDHDREPALPAKAVRKLTWASVGSFTGICAAIFFVPGAADVIPTAMFVGTAVAAGLGALVSHVYPGIRLSTRDAAADRRIRWWSGKFGQLTAKLSSLWLKKKAIPAELTYRPTELAISLAADALFDSLPRDQKKDLKELPALIERLQRDAQLMRRTVDDLNGALAGIGEQSAAGQSSALKGGFGAGLTDVRDKLRDDLAQKRDEASQKLGAAVSALENIRLNLLRLRAGTGSVAELTADLTAAREAQRELARAADAREEVALLLRGARPATRQPSPVTPHG